MEILGPKLGPILFQFPQFSPGVFPDRHAFTDRLVPFLNKLPRRPQIRHRNSQPGMARRRIRRLTPRPQNRPGATRPLLHARAPKSCKKSSTPSPPSWTYIRWLGDRKGIETQTLTWDKTIVDRTAELTSWVDFCFQIKRRGITVYGYANNHYAGHGPATIRHFRDLWRKKGHPQLPEGPLNPRGRRNGPERPPRANRATKPAPPQKQPSLFD